MEKLVSQKYGLESQQNLPLIPKLPQTVSEEKGALATIKLSNTGCSNTPNPLGVTDGPLSDVPRQNGGAHGSNDSQDDSDDGTGTVGYDSAGRDDGEGDVGAAIFRCRYCPAYVSRYRTSIKRHLFKQHGLKRDWKEHIEKVRDVSPQAPSYNTTTFDDESSFDQVGLADYGDATTDYTASSSLTQTVTKDQIQELPNQGKDTLLVETTADSMATDMLNDSTVSQLTLVQCPHCNFTVLATNLYALGQHLIKQHPDRISSKLPSLPSAPASPPAPPENCAPKESPERLLRRHTEAPTTSPPDSATIMGNIRKINVNAAVPGSAPKINFKCPLCDFTSEYKQSIKRHLDYRHHVRDHQPVAPNSKAAHVPDPVPHSGAPTNGLLNLYPATTTNVPKPTLLHNFDNCRAATTESPPPSFLPPLQCKLCEAFFISEIAYNRHMAATHDSHYTSQQQQQQLSATLWIGDEDEIGELEGQESDGSRRHHPFGTNENVLQAYRCPVCPYTTCDSVNFLTHFKGHEAAMASTVATLTANSFDSETSPTTAPPTLPFAEKNSKEHSKLFEALNKPTSHYFNINNINPKPNLSQASQMTVPTTSTSPTDTIDGSVSPLDSTSKYVLKCSLCHFSTPSHDRLVEHQVLKHRINVLDVKNPIKLYTKITKGHDDDYDSGGNEPSKRRLTSPDGRFDTKRDTSSPAIFKDILVSDDPHTAPPFKSSPILKVDETTKSEDNGTGGGVGPEKIPILKLYLQQNSGTNTTIGIPIPPATNSPPNSTIVPAHPTTHKLVIYSCRFCTHCDASHEAMRTHESAAHHDTSSSSSTCRGEPPNPMSNDVATDENLETFALQQNNNGTEKVSPSFEISHGSTSLISSRQPDILGADPNQNSTSWANDSTGSQEASATETCAYDNEGGLDAEASSSPRPHFTCRYCGYSHHLQRIVLQHETNKHFKHLQDLLPGQKFVRCKDCSYIAPSKAMLVKHRAQHDEGPMYCKYCDFSTFYSPNLERHLKRHAVKSFYKCHKCSYSSPSNQGIILHRDRHHNGRQFNVTSAQATKLYFDRRRGLKNLSDPTGLHPTQSPNDASYERETNLDFKNDWHGSWLRDEESRRSLQDFNVATTSDNQKRYRCPSSTDCHHLSSTLSELQYHVTAAHVSWQVVGCNICSVPVTSMAEYLAHLSDLHPLRYGRDSECNAGSTATTNRTHQVIKMGIKEEPDVESIWNVDKNSSNTSQKSPIRHEIMAKDRSEIKKAVSAGIPFVVSATTSSDVDDLSVLPGTDSHYRPKSANFDRTAESCVELDSQDNKSNPECGKAAPARPKNSGHPHVSKRYPHLGAIPNRPVYKRVLPHEKDKHCTLCSYSTKWSCDLRLHYRNRHKVSKPYECQDCKKTFAYASDLRTHLKKVHGVDSRTALYEKVYSTFRASPSQMQPYPSSPAAAANTNPDDGKFDSSDPKGSTKVRNALRYRLSVSHKSEISKDHDGLEDPPPDPSRNGNGGANIEIRNGSQPSIPRDSEELFPSSVMMDSLMSSPNLRHLFAQYTKYFCNSVQGTVISGRVDPVPTDYDIITRAPDSLKRHFVGSNSTPTIESDVVLAFMKAQASNSNLSQLSEGSSGDKVKDSKLTCSLTTKPSVGRRTLRLKGQPLPLRKSKTPEKCFLNGDLQPSQGMSLVYGRQPSPGPYGAHDLEDSVATDDALDSDSSPLLGKLIAGNQLSTMADPSETTPNDQYSYLKSVSYAMNDTLKRSKMMIKFPLASSSKRFKLNLPNSDIYYDLDKSKKEASNETYTINPVNLREDEATPTLPEKAELRPHLKIEENDDAYLSAYKLTTSHPSFDISTFGTTMAAISYDLANLNTTITTGDKSITSNNGPPKINNSITGQQQQHAIAKNSNISRTGSGKNVFGCPVCSYISNCAAKIKLHIAIHASEKLYHCSECGKRSYWSWDISKHIKAKHVNVAGACTMKSPQAMREIAELNKLAIRVMKPPPPLPPPMNSRDDSGLNGTATDFNYYNYANSIKPSPNPPTKVLRMEHQLYMHRQNLLKQQQEQQQQHENDELPKIQFSICEQGNNAMLKSNGPDMMVTIGEAMDKTSHSDYSIYSKPTASPINNVSVSGNIKKDTRRETSDSSNRHRDRSPTCSYYSNPLLVYRCKLCDYKNGRRLMTERHLYQAHEYKVLRRNVVDPSDTESDPFSPLYLEDRDILTLDSSAIMPVVDNYYDRILPVPGTGNSSSPLAPPTPQGSILSSYSIAPAQANSGQGGNGGGVIAFSDGSSAQMTRMVTNSLTTTAAGNPRTNVFPCSICPFISNKASAFKRHQELHQAPDPEARNIMSTGSNGSKMNTTNGQFFKCPFCPYFVPLKRMLWQHLRMHVPNPQEILNRLRSYDHNARICDLDYDTPLYEDQVKLTPYTLPWAWDQKCAGTEAKRTSKICQGSLPSHEVSDICDNNDTIGHRNSVEGHDTYDNSDGYDDDFKDYRSLIPPNDDCEDNGNRGDGIDTIMTDYDNMFKSLSGRVCGDKIVMLNDGTDSVNLNLSTYQQVGNESSRLTTDDGAAQWVVKDNPISVPSNNKKTIGTENKRKSRKPFSLSSMLLAATASKVQREKLEMLNNSIDPTTASSSSTKLQNPIVNMHNGSLQKLSGIGEGSRMMEIPFLHQHNIPNMSTSPPLLPSSQMLDNENEAILMNIPMSTDSSPELPTSETFNQSGDMKGTDNVDFIPSQPPKPCRWGKDGKDIGVAWGMKKGKYVRMFKCPYCPHLGTRRANVRIHINLHGTRQGLKGKIQQCPKCTFNCANPTRYINHLAMHRCGSLSTDPLRENEVSDIGIGETLPTIKEQVTAKRKKLDLKCSKCPAKFCLERMLKRHMRYHVRRFKFRCKICDYSAPKMYQLVRHEKLHTQLSPSAQHQSLINSNNNDSLPHLQHTSDTKQFKSLSANTLGEGRASQNSRFIKSLVSQCHGIKNLLDTPEQISSDCGLGQANDSLENKSENKNHSFLDQQESILSEYAKAFDTPHPGNGRYLTNPPIDETSESLMFPLGQNDQGDNTVAPKGRPNSAPCTTSASSVECVNCPFKTTSKLTIEKHCKLHVGRRDIFCQFCNYSARKKAPYERHMEFHFDLIHNFFPKTNYFMKQDDTILHTLNNIKMDDTSQSPTHDSSDQLNDPKKYDTSFKRCNDVAISKADLYHKNPHRPKLYPEGNEPSITPIAYRCSHCGRHFDCKINPSTTSVTNPDHSSDKKLSGGNMIEKGSAQTGSTTGNADEVGCDQFLSHKAYHLSSCGYCLTLPTQDQTGHKDITAPKDVPVGTLNNNTYKYDCLGRKRRCTAESMDMVSALSKRMCAAPSGQRVDFGSHNLFSTFCKPIPKY